MEAKDVTESEATITESGAKVSDKGTSNLKDTSTTEVEFTANLQMPGDYYEFTVTIANDGTVPAMLEAAPEPITLTEDQKKYMDCKVTYDTDGSELKAKDAIHAGKEVKIKVRVEYKKSVNPEELPKSSTPISSTYSLKFVQADTTANYKTTAD